MNMHYKAESIKSARCHLKNQAIIIQQESERC